LWPIKNPVNAGFIFWDPPRAPIDQTRYLLPVE
jgi:hypothetical protein